MKEMGDFGRMCTAVLCCYAVGLFGTLFVSADMTTWYAHLVKPALTPSPGVFVPVWIILYGLMGVAFGRVWCKGDMWCAWNGLFVVSLAFNAAWTVFFFGFHTILIALIDVACLAFLLAFLTLDAWETDRIGGYLMAPYLLWVLFAVYLNAGIWLLN